MAGAITFTTRLASVIIPCFNQLAFTRVCVSALVRHTRGPWELIVVDNGSCDGTPAYLQGLQDVSSVAVTVITNHEHQAFPVACRQGLKAARGNHLVLLDSGTIPTDDWLAQLRNYLNTAKRPEVCTSGDTKATHTPTE